jgi:DNA repair protein RadC
VSELYLKSANKYRKASMSEVCEAASTYLFEEAGKKRVLIDSPKKAQEFLRNQGGLEHEQFGVMYLNTRHRVIKVEILFNGTVDKAMVHPRELVKKVLGENAIAVILFHNHPSDMAEPSHADFELTHGLVKALDLFDIRVLDHVILAGAGIYSFAENGKL